MTTSTDPVSSPPATRNSHHDLVDMRPTRFDLTSGFFLTLILFLGVIVSLMFLLWTANRWASQSEIHHSPPVRTTFVDAGERPIDSEFAIPSEFEVRELTVTSVNESLVAVTGAADTLTELLEQLDDSLPRNSRVGLPGPVASQTIPDFEEDIVPRSERWQLNFTAPDQASYAAQLDFFRIELGVLGGAIQGIDLVSHLSTHPVSRQVADTAHEKRLYFIWTAPNRLSDFEHAILKQAGVNFSDRSVIRFLPMDLEHNLAVTELDFARAAGHESVTEIAKTVFQCVPAGVGHAFQVVDQRYR